MSILPLSPVHPYPAVLTRGTARRGVGRARLPVLGTVRGWLQRARDRDALARMDERGLRDLALSRYDVEYEIRKPFWRG